jgi:hypothetical protein
VGIGDTRLGGEGETENQELERQAGLQEVKRNLGGKGRKGKG